MNSTLTIKTGDLSEVPSGMEPLEDLADEFCYELALALRRILGLSAASDELGEEKEVNNYAEISDS